MPSETEVKQMTNQSWRSDDLFARIKQACYSGLGLEDLQSTVLRLIRQEVPFDAYCFNQNDPTTELLIGSIGEGVGGGEELRIFFERIYFEDYLQDFRQLGRSRRPVNRLSQTTGGRLEKALRYRVLWDRLGLGDELRVAFTAGHRTWGTATLFREKGSPFFRPEEAQLLARLSPHIGAGMRAAMLMAGTPDEAVAGTTPGMMMLGPTGQVEFVTPAAEHWLREIEDFPGQWSRVRELPVVLLTLSSALKRALLMLTEDQQELVPAITLRGRSGAWITLHASTAASPDGGPGRTTILFGLAVPGEVSRLQTSIFGLTAQEEAVCKLILRGATTEQIAQALFISPYTVQDHLKRIFDKVGVRSRRELVKQLFLQSPSIHPAEGGL